jgi:energy-coupling factor transporter ATP-binding protein EcfA2
MDLRSACPYPGLRPFETNEADIFFGRARAINDLVKKLESFRFVAVVGPSGCGKSSLIRAGLLSALVLRTSPDKRAQKLALMRPGNSPIENLVAALSESLFEDEYHSYPNDLPLRIKSDPTILINTLAAGRGRNCEYVFVIDQFEEIFRLLHAGDEEETHSFVRLLLTIAESRDLQASVIVTMRADYVGDCTVFEGLPEAMNLGQFLVPRLTKNETRETLERPAAIRGAILEEPLIDQVLKDIGTHSDQLPLMQHAMRRVWGKAVQASVDAGESKLVLRLGDYEAIGSMHSSLSIHADEIFYGLDVESMQVAEKMFQLMCELGRYGDFVRRPVRIREVAEVAQTSVEKVIVVAKAFSELLSIGATGSELFADDLLDITHEALLRNWSRLKSWAEAERRSAQMYLRIEAAARRRENGEEALWRDPQLSLALEWWETSRPTVAWASRYGSDFELSEKFLFLSRTQRERDRALAQKDKKRPSTKVFISYRRTDNPDGAARIYERLMQHFGRDAIFYDQISIPYGEDFRRFIDEQIRECGVLLAIIGRGWLDIRYEDGPAKGSRRLDEPTDHVRTEIEAALRANVQVIPVLVGVPHQLPREKELPAGPIGQLSNLNAVDVCSEQDFHQRTDELIKQIEDIIGPVRKYRQLFNRWWK